MTTVSPDFFSQPFSHKYWGCKLKLLALSSGGGCVLVARLPEGTMSWINTKELKLDTAEPSAAEPSAADLPPPAMKPEPPEEKRRDKTSNFRVRLYSDHNLNDPAYYTEMVPAYTLKGAAEYFARKLEIWGEISEKQSPQGIDGYDPDSRQGHHFSVRKRWQATPIARIISYPPPSEKK